MSSARIDINGKLLNLHIDRTKPALLENDMSDEAWTKFCDDIDDLLRANFKSLGCFCGCMLVFLIAGLITKGFFLLVALNNGFGIGVTAILMLILSIFICALFFCAQRKVQNVKKKINVDLKTFLKDVSMTQSQLLFHLREQVIVTGDSTYKKQNPFIEVSITTDEASDP